MRIESSNEPLFIRSPHYCWRQCRSEDLRESKTESWGFLGFGFDDGSNNTRTHLFAGIYDVVSRFRNLFKTNRRILVYLGFKFHFKNF